jgi:branched-chain amino acid aminotransferase
MMNLSSHFIQACTNGRLHDAREPSICALNRGFLYGDAIYEVWRSYHGVIFAWDEHWARLQKSAAALSLDLPFGPAAALREVHRTVAAYQEASHSEGDFYIRMQVTRGSGSIGLDPALADASDYVLLVQPNSSYPESKLRAGLKLSIATNLRRNPPEALNPAWKTGNYLNNILCLREARGRGADEVLILNSAGELTEAAVSNIAFVRNGEMVTPSLSSGLLAGITRGLVIRDIAESAGIPVREQRLLPSDLAEMEECFLMSTTKDITPVSSIDSYTFRVEQDSVTARLKSAFLKYAGAYAKSHPELRVREVPREAN